MVAGALSGCGLPPDLIVNDSDLVDLWSDDSPGPPAPHPCAGETWGGVDSDLVITAIHVAETAVEGGDGSLNQPFTSLDDAIAASRLDEGVKVVILWPGSYEASLDLGADLGDDTLQIHGCSADEVTIEAPDSDSPVIKVSAVQGFALSGVTLSGGKRGLWVWQGAAVAVSDLHAVDNNLLGIVIDGVSTVATLIDIRVTDPNDVAGLGGYGLIVQGSTVDVKNLTVIGATGNGVVVDGGMANAVFSTVSVTGTAARSDGQQGRGMTVQEQASAWITDGTFADNHDAGVFGLGATALDLKNVSVSGTAASTLPTSGDTTGDGIVITDNPELEPYDQVYFTSSLEDVTVEGSSRAGVLLSGNGLGVVLTGTLSIIPSAVDPGAGKPLMQADAVVTGGEIHRLEAGLLFDASPTPIDDFAP